MSISEERKAEIVQSVMDNKHLEGMRQLLHVNPELALQTMANELAQGVPALQNTKDPAYKAAFKKHLEEVCEALGYVVTSWDPDEEKVHPEVTAADRDKTKPRHHFPAQVGTVVEGAASAGGSAS